MQNARSIVRKLAVKAERVRDTITLDHQDRHRRRMAMTADGGLAFLLDLEKATLLEDGDALKLDDGGLIQVAAKPEELIAITAGTPLRLMKLAWHLGNRHVPTEITSETLYIAPDHVLVEMVRGLGGSAEPVTRPFRPERGAYHEHSGEAQHGHDHSHDDHGHTHNEHEHRHAHGESCGCGHKHD